MTDEVHGLSRGPWNAGDRLGTGLSLAVAGGLWALSWWGTSSTPHQFRQLMWLNVGVVGTVVACGAIGVWILAGRRAVGSRRRQLLLDVAPPASGWRSDLEAHDLPSDAPASATPVKLVGSARYHRRECLLVTGKPVVAATSRDRLQPCSTCHPNPSETPSQ